LKGHLEFTPFRVGLLYLLGTFMGTGIGMVIAEGSMRGGAAAMTASAALTSVSVVLGAYRRTSAPP
jgi:hypothetical protein